MRTILPIAPTRNPTGQTIVARVKKMASSVLNRPLIILCRKTKTTNPMGDAPVISKNLLSFPSIWVLMVRTSNITPSTKSIGQAIKALKRIGINWANITIIDMANTTTNAQNIGQINLPFTPSSLT